MRACVHACMRACVRALARAVFTRGQDCASRAFNQSFEPSRCAVRRCFRMYGMWIERAHKRARAAAAAAAAAARGLNPRPLLLCRLALRVSPQVEWTDHQRAAAAVMAALPDAKLPEGSYSVPQTSRHGRPPCRKHARGDYSSSAIDHVPKLGGANKVPASTPVTAIANVAHRRAL